MFIRVCTLRTPTRKVRQVFALGFSAVGGGQFLGQFGRGQQWEPHPAGIVHQHAIAILLAVAARNRLQIFHLHQVGQAVAGANPQQPQGVPIPPPPQAPVGAAWYVSVDGKQTGPFSDAELTQQISAGQINAATKVIRQGQQEWQDASGYPELASLLATYTPPPPPPPSDPTATA